MKNRNGEIHFNNEGYEMEIVESENLNGYTISFKNGIKVKNLQYGNIKKGGIKNPLHPSIFGIGYLGTSKNKSKTKCYITWRGMLERCYNKLTQEKHPTYKECSVDERWHNFQVFTEWYNENYKEGFALDKDILVKGNKIYSPETCCFLPVEINNLLLPKRKNCKNKLPIGVTKVRSGRFLSKLTTKNGIYNLGTFDTVEEAFNIYKIAKETYIKEVAETWKACIKETVYYILINHTVEITD